MKRRREDSYFGIHFDFHAMVGEVVPSVYDPETVGDMLNRVRPDFVQCDTKGHAGLSSYPTKIGTPANEIKKDVLRMWRNLTQERDIALYGHHSGLYDINIAKKHPEWAVRDEKGVVSDSFISPFSPYADEILIPQIKELARDYKLDGAWIDGESWGTRTDYSSWAVEKYTLKTGKKPPVRSDDNFEEYREFCRQGFRDYVSHYIEEVKKEFPDFQITSNWIYSGQMPEKITVPVDFLSGDYNTQRSVESARFCGRCASNRGLAWDMVAWGHNARPCDWRTHDRTQKEYVQYCQEASEIISMGGAFVFFNIMYGTGGCVQKWMIPTWEKVARFLRERESICFKTDPIHEILIIFPEAVTPHDIDTLYLHSNPGHMAITGWINVIQNLQYSCDIANECDITKELLDKFSVVIIPGCKLKYRNTSRCVKAYINDGGKVVCDMKALEDFSEITEFDSISFEDKLIFVDGGQRLASLPVSTLTCSVNGEISGVYYSDNYYNDAPSPAAFTKRFGNGSFCGICFDFSKVYPDNISVALNMFVNSQLCAIGYEPRVKVKNASYVDVILRKKNKLLLVNLINYAGVHNCEEVRSYSEIPPIHDIDIEIKSENAPINVFMEPGHKKIDYEFKDKKISLTVDRLDIHSIVAVEYNTNI